MSTAEKTWTDSETEVRARLQALAAYQGVQPLENVDEFIDEFKGLWPDEEIDEFVAALARWRREGAARSRP